MSDSGEIVQYFVVNEDLGMSGGKVAAQVSHAAVLIALSAVFEEQLEPVPPAPGQRYLQLQRNDGVPSDYVRWANDSFKKIVLRAPQPIMDRLERVVRDAGIGVAIRDAGHTQVAANSLTVVGLRPMARHAAAPLVGDLRLLR